MMALLRVSVRSWLRLMSSDFPRAGRSLPRWPTPVPGQLLLAVCSCLWVCLTSQHGAGLPSKRAIKTKMKAGAAVHL